MYILPQGLSFDSRGLLATPGARLLLFQDPSLGTLLQYVYGNSTYPLALRREIAVPSRPVSL